MCLIGPQASWAHEIFDARGFSANRDFFSQLPYEHIDPLTGNLLLTTTDLVLPGNAGFDLRIQRTYNSKIHQSYQTLGLTLGEDSWAGVGWSLHLGRVLNPNQDPPGPIEMPDGSQHKLFSHIDGSGRFITRDYWIYERTAGTGGAPLLRLPNGMTYTFGPQTLTNEPLLVQRQVRYVTLIQDPFGNQTTVQYAGATRPSDAISSITQNLGSGQTRVVTFNSDAASPGALRSMTYTNGSRIHTWTYAHEGTNALGYTVLTSVTPPVGPGWSYGYNTGGPPSYELVSLTSPQGGTVTYTYAEQNFYFATPILIRARAVIQRVTGGRSPAGTWTYAYSQGASSNQSIITSPCGTQTTRTFLGIGPSPPVAVWQIGLLQSKVLKEGATTLEQEQMTWLGSALISDNTDTTANGIFDAGIKVPLVQVRTVTRGTQNYTTTNSYNATNLNDYGRPFQVQESGNLSRTTTRTFQYGFTPYIVDKVASETVNVSGQQFTRSWAYEAATGFNTSETTYGIQTAFTKNPQGNVASATNANGNITNYSYSWGVQSAITPPVAGTQTTRVIAPDGTVTSETRRGFTTSFQYDLLFRPTSRTPPVGNATSIAYTNTGGAFVSTTTTRGSSSVVATHDGLGRTTGTSNSVLVQTQTTFDSCGRKSYESYPFGAGVANAGTTYTYDGLDRVTRKTNPGGSFVTYAYSTTNGIDVTISDEANHTTVQDWSAFGDPRDARLVQVTDAVGTRFSYSYNAVGSLTGVTPSLQPVAGARTLTYNIRNQLTSETHPESGTTSYSYYSAGNLQTKTDRFGQTTFIYDGNVRLTTIQRPAGYTTYNTTIAYDGADNRTSVSNSFVSSTFGYDGANRLTSRTDVINGQSFGTTYVPDGNDNIGRINYPSANAVVYTYDSANRIATVTDGSGAVTYANGFTYHPSGSVLSFKPGGTGSANPAQTFTYDNRYRLSTLNTGRRALTYGYDNVGNVTSINESTRSGMNRSPIQYDPLDRLTSVSGFAGGTYAYDELGNRKTSSVGGSITYNYNTSTARLSSFTGSGSLSYDLNGNLTGDGPRTYTYTPENQLETVGPGVATYRYDGDNMRKMKIDNVFGATRYYVHGPGSQILSEFEEACAGNRQLVRDYVYANGRLLAAVKPANPPVQVGFAFTGSSPNEATGVVGIGLQVITSNGLPTTCPVSVRYSTSDGTAVAGTDYTSTSGLLTIPAGLATGAISVPLANDTFCRGNRTFTLSLGETTGARVAAGGGVHTVTIVDDDVTCITGSKSVSGDRTPDGGAVVYTIVLTNTGSQAQLDRPGNEFTDNLNDPILNATPRLTYVSASATSGTTTTNVPADPNTVFWNGSIPASGSVTVTINARTNLSTAGLEVKNQGIVSYDRNNDGTNESTVQTNLTTFQVGIGRTNYYTITPCRLVDTRNPNGVLGGPALTAGAPRTFPVTGACGIPSTAKAISLNVTVVGSTTAGSVTLYPAFIPPTGTTTINYSAGQIRANNALMTLNAGQLSAVANQASGTVHILIDINGYFQ